MRLTEEAIAALGMNDYLCDIAMQEIKNMCSNHNYKITISSDISIDLDCGFEGVKNCNINSVTYHFIYDTIFLTSIIVESGEIVTTKLLRDDALEVLKILSSAEFVPEIDFMKRFPRLECVREEKDILEMWELFEQVPVNNEDEIETDFLYWPKGTDKFDIWHWFDNHYSKGLSAILY